LVILLAAALAVKYWYITLFLVLLAIPAGVVIAKANKAQQLRARAQAERQRNEAQKLARTQAEAHAEAQRKWLQSPAPPLVVPLRFSEQWFAANIPRMHPGQIPVLVEEMHARGWTDQRIAQRIGRYLAVNPFLDALRESKRR
jgi:hypothetical protein